MFENMYGTMRLHTAPERLVNPTHSSETHLLLLQPVLSEDAQALASPGKIVVIEIVSLNILVLLRNVDKCENMIIKMFFIKTFIF